MGTWFSLCHASVVAAREDCWVQRNRIVESHSPAPLPYDTLHGCYAKIRITYQDGGVRWQGFRITSPCEVHGESPYNRQLGGARVKVRP